MAKRRIDPEKYRILNKSGFMDVVCRSGVWKDGSLSNEYLIALYEKDKTTPIIEIRYDSTDGLLNINDKSLEEKEMWKYRGELDELRFALKEALKSGIFRPLFAEDLEKLIKDDSPVWDI